jgi:hypothetical protein
LFSFAKNPTITVKALLHSTPLISNFHLPFSSEAYHQFLNLESRLNDIHILPEPDLWSFSWGNSLFSAAKAYKVLVGNHGVHPIFKWLWKPKCQMKHKIFFWLLLNDRINTKDLLQRKNYNLDSYTCDMCIL